LTLINLTKLTAKNIKRPTTEEKLLAKKEFQKIKKMKPPTIKKVGEKEILEFLSNLESLRLPEEYPILLTDNIWYYFEDPEEAFLLYRGRKVWNSEKGVLIED